VEALLANVCLLRLSTIPGVYQQLNCQVFFQNSPSFIHLVTILMSMPSASIGTLLCLEIFGFDLSLIAVIGLILPIGIVKKNVIAQRGLCLCFR
jgi:hypothetical protein